MKIVFFGTPKFAVKSLESLYNTKNIEILAVVTQPDKKVGRNALITSSPVKTFAKSLNLKILQPKNTKELEELLSSFKVDFFIVIAYGMLLTKKTLEMPKYGTINVHASMLPKYRGASPIQEAILNGDEETGISIMKIDEKLDHGPIFLLRKIPITNDNLESLTEKLSEVSKIILPYALEDIIQGTLKEIPQNEKIATYCRKIKKEDGKIDFSKTAEEISNMIKAYTPWPSVYTDFNGKKLKILKAEIENSTIPKNPGTFFVENKSLKISTKKGNLIPEIVQLEGKKETEISAFLNGYKHLIK